jgi:hypothetical protein
LVIAVGVLYFFTTRKLKSGKQVPEVGMFKKMFDIISVVKKLHVPQLENATRYGKMPLSCQQGIHGIDIVNC